jgi:hypothetical protein
MKKIITVLALSIITGCSHAPLREDQVSNSINPKLRVADFNKDKDLCWYEANKAALGSSGGNLHGTAYWINQNNIENAKIEVVAQCMKIKGWSWTD